MRNCGLVSWYHMTANHVVQFIDKDHTRLEAYCLTAFAAGENSPLRVAAVRRSVDELVRRNGKVADQVTHRRAAELNGRHRLFADRAPALEDPCVLFIAVPPEAVQNRVAAAGASLPPRKPTRCGTALPRRTVER
jgi:hypothetical protein